MLYNTISKNYFNCEQSGCEYEGHIAYHSRIECHERSSLYNRLQKVVKVVCLYVCCVCVTL